jgi:MYXO-CTERM domain-containing protein
MLFLASFLSTTITIDPPPDVLYAMSEGVRLDEPVVGDFDFDGYDDLAWTGSGAADLPDVGVFVARGGPSGLPAVPDLAWRPDDGLDGEENAQIAAADVNSDGLVDLIVGSPGPLFSTTTAGQIAVHLGSSSGLSTTPSSVIVGDPGAVLGAGLRAVGDVDGDGYADMAVGRTLSGAPDLGWELYRGAPDGQLVYSGFLFQAFDVLGADFTGDGLSDLAVADHGDGVVSLWPGSSAGLPSAPAWTLADASLWLARADLTGDGVVDLGVYGNDLKGRADLDWYDLTTLGTAPVTTQIVPAMGRADGLGDLDGDGLDDWAVHSPQHATRILLGSDPTVSVADYDIASSTYTEGTHWQWAAVGDFDADGCDDLVLQVHALWTVFSGYYGSLYDDDALMGVWMCPVARIGGSTGIDTAGDTGTPGGTGPQTSATSDTTSTSTSDDAAGEDKPEDGASTDGDCGCATGRPAGAWMALGLLAVLRRRRRVGAESA